MQKISDVLIKAKALIENPDNWLQINFITDENNNPVDSIYDAKKFCLVAAISKAVRDMHDPSTYDPYTYGPNLYIKTKNEALNFVRHTLDICGLVYFNDTSTHEQVIEGLSRCIEEAKGKGK